MLGNFVVWGFYKLTVSGKGILHDNFGWQSVGSISKRASAYLGFGLELVWNWITSVEIACSVDLLWRGDIWRVSGIFWTDTQRKGKAGIARLGLECLGGMRSTLWGLTTIRARIWIAQLVELDSTRTGLAVSKIRINLLLLLGLRTPVMWHPGPERSLPSKPLCQWRNQIQTCPGEGQISLCKLCTGNLYQVNSPQRWKD